MNQAKTTFVAAICLFYCVQSTGWSQNVYKDYVQDKYAQYSPFDHANRGLLYRLQTGHAGWFGKCDDDRQKMVSPYIDWHCRKPDACLPGQFTKDLFNDIFRKSDRFRDGAGGCICGNCESSECNGNCGASVQDLTIGSNNSQVETQQRQSVVSKGKGARSTFATKPATQNQSPRQVKSNRGYFSRNQTPVRVATAESRSNDPRYSSEASLVIPTGDQRMPSLKAKSQNVSDSRFQLDGSPSLKTARLTGHPNATAVTSTPSQDRKADPQHFQFRLIGGSTNR